MDRKVIVMDFTGVYDEETFSHSPGMEWIDCRHLSGTECYCDKEGSEALCKLIESYPAEGIHFIDSGDFHYVTKFWTDKITRPFSLIVFDHHPDMQPPLFDEMLSCGSWVKDVMDANPYLRKVILVGASERLMQAVPRVYRERVDFYGECELHHAEAWKRFASECLDEPVYISIDKDVLNPQAAATNWDQGSMSLDSLEHLLTVILRQEQVIGVDICGECATTLDCFAEQKEATLDSRANQELLRLITVSAK